MKKTRLLALVFALVICVPLLFSCAQDALTLEAVKEDPLKFLQEGQRSTWSATPMNVLLTEADTYSWEIGLDSAETGEMELAVFADEANEKAVLSLSAEEVFQGEAALYLSKEELVASSPMLSFIDEGEALGLKLSLDKEDIMESATYKALVDFGLGGELGEIIAALEGLDLSDWTESAADASELFTVEAVEEGKAALPDGETDSIVLTLKLNEKAFEEYYDAMLEGMLVGMGDELPAETREMILEEAKASLPAITGEFDYYLSKRNGDLILVVADLTMTSEGEDTAIHLEFAYGAEPSKLFLPSFICTAESGGEKIEFSAKSSISDGTLVLDGTVSDGEETLGTLKLTLQQDGNYVLELIDEEETITLTGVLKATETGLEFTLEAEDELELRMAYETGVTLPETPEYKDLLDFTAEEIQSVILGVTEPTILF